MASVGPIIFSAGAADAFAWAPLSFRQLLPMASLGPNNLLVAASDNLKWAQ